MGGSTKLRRTRSSNPSTAPGPDLSEVYDRYASGLYQQALLILADPGLAEQAVCDVLVSEYSQPDARLSTGPDYGCRLAISVYRRCQELAVSSPGTGRPALERASPAHSDDIGAAELLTLKERAALALVLFGRLGYVPASRELAISPREMAVLLRDALRRLAQRPSPWHFTAEGGGATQV